MCVYIRLNLNKVFLVSDCGTLHSKVSSVSQPCRDQPTRTKTLLYEQSLHKILCLKIKQKFSNTSPITLCLSLQPCTEKNRAQSWEGVTNYVQAVSIKSFFKPKSWIRNYSVLTFSVVPPSFELLLLPWQFSPWLPWYSKFSCPTGIQIHWCGLCGSKVNYQSMVNS